MGIDYSYECTKAKIVKELGTFGERRVLLCNLWFDDEHGHALAPAKKVVVVVEGGSADIEKYPENFLPEDADKATWKRFQKLCDASDIGYHVYNDNELAKMLA
jgi:hypothetical protein